MMQITNPYLFMSYRSTESEIALKLAQDLRGSGIFVWVDQLKGLTTGVNWVDALETVIDNANGMIVMLSPAYLESKFSRRELLRGDDRNYDIFPVLIADTPILPFELQNIQYIDMRNWRDDTSYNQQFSKLKEHIRDRIEFDFRKSYVTEITEIPSSIQFAHYVEDKLDDVSKQINRISPSKRSHQMRKQRLTEQLEQYAREYEIARNQAKVELSEVYRDRLNALLEQMEQKIDEIGESLDELE